MLQLPASICPFITRNRYFMNLPPDDQQLLEELCQQHGVSAAKVLQLLQTVREYEFKERRIGVHAALRDVLNTRYPESDLKSDNRWTNKN